MSDSYRRVTLVTGFHSGGLTKLARLLEHNGYQILFPGQDLDVTCYGAQGQVLYDEYRENIEVLRLNEEMLAASSLIWYEAEERAVHGLLSPQPLIRRFSQESSVLLCDPRCCFTLAAYSGHVTDVVYVACSNPQAVASGLTAAWGYDDEHWLEQHRIYESVFKQHNVRATTIMDTECGDPLRVQARLNALLA